MQPQKKEMRTVLISTDANEQPKVDPVSPFKCSFLVYDPNSHLNENKHQCLMDLFGTLDGFSENYVL